jgi:hypothetical protein
MDSDDAHGMLPDCLKSKTGVMSLPCYGFFFWTGMDGAFSSAWSECRLWDDIWIVWIDSCRSETRDSVAKGGSTHPCFCA